MSQAVTEPKPKRYRLKSMVLARMLAELTVLFILFVLPGILMLTGQFQHASITGKVVLFSLSLVSAVILPAYAFITWRVKIDQNGLTTMSLAKKEHCAWSSIKRISRRSNWNWVRYVVEHQGGELSFPIWLNHVDDLLEIIRQHLPKGSGANNPFRKFSQDRISLIFQCVQAALGVGLVIVFWFFFAELAQRQSTNQTDLSMVFVFCLIITIMFLWRTSVVFLMPKSVELTPSGIIIDTMLFSRRITWQNVLKITPSYPLLPEGFMLATERGSFLIGNGMDSADELVASLKGKIEGGQPLATASSAARARAAESEFLSGAAKSIDDSANDQGHTINTASKQKIELETTSTTPAQSEGTSSDTTIDNIENNGDVLEAAAELKAQVRAKPAPTGKKADRKFRKRKKKNNP